MADEKAAGKAEAPKSSGVRVKLPKHVTSLSYDGMPIKVDADNVVEVSASLAKVLVESHGAVYHTGK